MAWSTADIDIIDEAIKESSLEVTFSDGRKVKYRNMDELLRARSLGNQIINNGRSVAYASFPYTGGLF